MNYSLSPHFVEVAVVMVVWWIVRQDMEGIDCSLFPSPHFLEPQQWLLVCHDFDYDGGGGGGGGQVAVVIVVLGIVGEDMEGIDWV